MRIFIDTGIRVSGLAGLRYDPDEEDRNDVFLTQRRLRIRLRGADETWVPIGKKAAAAVDKYIRARARHPQAASPWLWLGVQGYNTARMTDSGVRDMVGRRGEQAGIQNVHPHRFRRSFADSCLATLARGIAKPIEDSSRPSWRISPTRFVDYGFVLACQSRT